MVNEMHAAQSGMVINANERKFTESLFFRMILTLRS